MGYMSSLHTDEVKRKVCTDQVSHMRAVVDADFTSFLQELTVKFRDPSQRWGFVGKGIGRCRRGVDNEGGSVIDRDGQHGGGGGGGTLTDPLSSGRARQEELVKSSSSLIEILDSFWYGARPWLFLLPHTGSVVTVVVSQVVSGLTLIW